MVTQAKHGVRVFIVKIRKYLLGAAGAYVLEFSIIGMWDYISGLNYFFPK